MPSSTAVTVTRVSPGAGVSASDVAATEEPLEIRLGDRPFVVIMRTPGADFDLAAGFLLAEQILKHPSEIGSMRHCVAAPREPGGDEEVNGNVLNVWLTGDAAMRASERLARKRTVASSTSCGVCGRQSIDDLMEGVPPVTAHWTMASEAISALPDTLREAQRVFAETGGLHAAGIFDRSGTLLRVAEDVGRHNAVDKVIGAELMTGQVPLTDRILFVSGRTSFEILQKALVAGIPLVASVSAPSSLAIDLAKQGNVTLVGFVRGTTFNVYSGAERVAIAPNAQFTISNAQ